MKKMVFLSYTFPPQSSGAVPVILNLIKHMPRNGWEILPLVAGNRRDLSLDPSLEKCLPPGLRITSVPMFELPGTGNRRTVGDQAQQKERAKRGWLRRTLRRILNNYLLVPDRVILWLPTVVPAGISLVNREKPQVIVSHGPHHSTHVLGRIISIFTGVPHVMYFGDLWTQDSYMLFESRFNLAFERLLERTLLRSAAGIVASTPGSLAVLMSINGESSPPGGILYNGYDADNVPDTDIPSVSGGEYIQATFTGNFWSEHTPYAMFRGIAEFLRLEPEAPFRLRMAGSVEPAFSNWPEEMGIDSVIDRVGVVPFREIRKFQAESDLLVVSLPPRPGSEFKCSSKLSEYLSTGVPILAIAPEGELTGWVREFDAGYVAQPNPESVAGVLSEIHRDWKEGKLKRRIPSEAIAETFEAGRTVARFCSFLDALVIVADND